MYNHAIIMWPLSIATAQIEEMLEFCSKFRPFTFETFQGDSIKLCISENVSFPYVDSSLRPSALKSMAHAAIPFSSHSLIGFSIISFSHQLE